MFIGWSFSAAMLPWFSSQAGSRERIAQGFELGTKATAAVLVPVGLTFMLFAEPLIELLYGSEYEPAVTPLRFLGAMRGVPGHQQPGRQPGDRPRPPAGLRRRRRGRDWWATWR